MSTRLRLSSKHRCIIILRVFESKPSNEVIAENNRHNADLYHHKVYFLNN